MTRSDIRVKAYAVFRRGTEILVHKIHEKDGSLKGYRVPGGHVEFGEKSLDAIHREIREELNAAITDVSLLMVTENIFVFHDLPGHEITFVYNANFADPSFYKMDDIIGDEVGQKFTLYWIDPDKLPSGVLLFPSGLKEAL